MLAYLLMFSNILANTGIFLNVNMVIANCGILCHCYNVRRGMPKQLRMQQQAACLCVHTCRQYKCMSWVQDGMYTLSEMECMGSCVNAPMIAVADYSGPDVRSFSYTYYEDLTPEDAVSIMEDLKAGKKPRVSHLLYQ